MLFSCGDYMWMSHKNGEFLDIGWKTPLRKRLIVICHCLLSMIYFIYLFIYFHLNLMLEECWTSVRKQESRRNSLSTTAICASGTLCLALADCFSFCHCNWPSNHNNSSSPGVRARGPGNSHPDRLWGRRGNKQAQYRQAQIRLSLHCKWWRCECPELVLLYRLLWYEQW